MSLVQDKQEQIIRLYTARSWLYHGFFFHLLRYHKRIESILRNQSYIHSQMNVLDAGCGSGLLTKVLWKEAKEKQADNMVFHAFDLTPHMIDQFNAWIDRNGASNIRTQQGDGLNLQTLPADWNGYDLIVTSGMLEYLPKERLADAFRGLKTLLKPDGIIFVCMTKTSRASQLLVTKWWKAESYTQKEVESALADAGFTDVRVIRPQGMYKIAKEGIIVMEAIN